MTRETLMPHQREDGNLIDRARYLLAVNTGSSSLRASLFCAEGGAEPAREAAIEINRIGKPGSRLVEQTDARRHEESVEVRDHRAALGMLRDWLQVTGRLGQLDAVGHRVVHGGSAFRQPMLVTSEMLAALDKLAPIDPEHLPQAIGAMRDLTSWLPETPQVACFDTAFHRTMPRIAQIYPLPRRFTESGLIRFGFHGLSCESIMHQLGETVPKRLIIAHLGNGASITSVLRGRSVETTMGFTPTGGLMMGTRTGDLDPGALLYLMDKEKLTTADASVLLNKQSGLLGVSGSSSDMRDLLERRTTDPAADEAVSLYSYTARKAIGSMAAALGGLDLLVFTGGIGEHAAPVRDEICAALEFIGIQLDPARNDRHGPSISQDSSRVSVRVVQTDEESVIARHASQFVTSEGEADV